MATKRFASDLAFLWHSEHIQMIPPVCVSTAVSPVSSAMRPTAERSSEVADLPHGHLYVYVATFYSHSSDLFLQDHTSSPTLCAASHLSTSFLMAFFLEGAVTFSFEYSHPPFC